jgi:glycosyltransferase involved in cell wall biosynthesis
LIRVLTYSSFFPNAEQPLHGIAVAERLRHLLATGRAGTHIVAPVPWFPAASHRLFGRYARFARVARQEQWQGYEVLHPRYPVIPKLGTSLTPWLMAQWTRATVTDLLAREEFDVIDAHGIYPDGVAATLIGRWLDRPVVLTARGSDVNLYRDFSLPRRWLQWATRTSAAVITVSESLKDALVEIGAEPGRITVLRNGVDLERFRPLERAAIRERLRLTGTVLLSVGNLLELKGHHLAIEALARLPGAQLLIAGDGPMRSALETQAAALGLAPRVRFLGAVPNSELPAYYNAADMLVLASSREGMANVLLESLACGTPVVTTAVGGSPEVVNSPAAGVLLATRSVNALVEAVNGLAAAPPSRQATRAHAERFGWVPTTRGQMEVFERVCRRAPTGHRVCA